MKKQKIVHVALAIEGKKPKFQPKVPHMQEKIAKILKIDSAQIGITITSGDGMTDFGCGEGVQCFCVMSTVEYRS